MSQQKQTHWADCSSRQRAVAVMVEEVGWGPGHSAASSDNQFVGTYPLPLLEAVAAENSKKLEEVGAVQWVGSVHVWWSHDFVAGPGELEQARSTQSYLGRTVAAGPVAAASVAAVDMPAVVVAVVERERKRIVNLNLDLLQLAERKDGRYSPAVAVVVVSVVGDVVEVVDGWLTKKHSMLWPLERKDVCVGGRNREQRKG